MLGSVAILAQGTADFSYGAYQLITRDDSLLAGNCQQRVAVLRLQIAVVVRSLSKPAPGGFRANKLTRREGWQGPAFPAIVSPALPAFPPPPPHPARAVVIACGACPGPLVRRSGCSRAGSGTSRRELFGLLGRAAGSCFRRGPGSAGSAGQLSSLFPSTSFSFSPSSSPQLSNATRHDAT